MVCICLFLFLVLLGKIFLWILCWDCQGLGRDIIVCSWLLIDFLRWHISYHVMKLMMLLILLICSFEKLFVCMVCPTQLFLIVMLNFLVIFGNFLVIFGRLYGQNWGLSF